LLYYRLNSYQIVKFIAFSESKEYLNYIIVPFNIFIKISTTSIILLIGIALTSFKIRLSQLIEVVIKAEYVFFLPITFEIIYFRYFKPEHTFLDIQYNSSLSLLSIFDYKKLEPWLIYPLQTINLFEVAYIIYLSYQIGYLTKTNVYDGLKIVSYSYIPALLLWVTVVMFFNLNNS
jgi:hypothetical protein